MLKLIKTNKQIIYLLVLIVILLAVSSIGNNYNKDIFIQIFGTKADNLNNKDAYIEKDEVYISLNILKTYIDEDVFYDKVSRSLVITSKDHILNIKVGKLDASLDYNKIKLEKELVETNKIIYVPVSSINNIYNIDTIINNEHKIYVVNNNKEQVSLKNNKTNIYSKTTIKSEVSGRLNKLENIDVYYNLSNSDWVLVKTKSGSSGYIQKYSLSKESIQRLAIKQENLKANDSKENMLSKSIKINGVVYTDDKNISNIYKDNNLENIFVDMFEVLKTNGQLDTDDINQNWIDSAKKSGYKVYANITNGFTSSNFDNTVIARVIRNEYTRGALVVNIANEAVKYKLDGIVIDFEGVKKADEEIYIQFLKELSIAMKKNNKKLMIKGNANINNADTSKALKYIDYYILEGYNHRNLFSNISGSDSDINKISEDIDNIINKNNGIYSAKVILELPIYSILWEEKNSKILSSNIYSQNAMQDYISKNKLTINLDKKVNQNYVEMTKGSITYKMWLEDKYSIKEKIKLVKSKNLSGIIINKAGDESNNLITNILK